MKTLNLVTCKYELYDQISRISSVSYVWAAIFINTILVQTIICARFDVICKLITIFNKSMTWERIPMQLEMHVDFHGKEEKCVNLFEDDAF